MKNSCGCCEGTSELTPAPTANRPGLDALIFRVGTHAAFFETMKARLSSVTVKQGAQNETTRPLEALTTRDPGDFAIAFLDGWATIADLLTFYQERIANEGYLRTATERRSVLELARLVGYELKPGVASTVHLAYTIDDNFKEEALLAPGERSQTVPGPGELPQTFETVEELRARARWNKLRPRMKRPQTWESIEKRGGIYLKGVNTNLKPNDMLLVRSAAVSVPRLGRVVKVEPDAAAGYTFVTARGWQESPAPAAGAAVAAFTGPDAASQQYVNAVGTVVRHYSDIDHFNIKSNTKTAQTVLGVLSDLDDGLREEMTPAEVKQLVDTALPPLKAELEKAVQKNFTLLKPWIKGLVDDLEVIAESVAEGNTPFGTTGSALSFGPQTLAFDDGSGMGNIMIALAAPPSVPPPNSAKLLRRPESAFAEGSDTTLQVAGAAHSDLRENLPRAIESLSATRPNDIEVYAMRLKAGVYGSTAPKRPVLDGQGKVVGSQEWPLDGTETLAISMEIQAQEQNSKPGNAAMMLKRGQEQFAVSFVIDDEDVTVKAVGDVSVEFSRGTSFPAPGEFTITIEKLGLILALKGKGDTIFSFAVKSLTSASLLGERDIGLNETETVFVRGRNVTVSHVKFSDNRFIQLSIESPQSPTPRDIIPLDATFDQITPGSWVAIERSPTTALLIAQVLAARVVSKSDYNFPAKVTQLTLTNGRKDAGNKSFISTNDWISAEDLWLSDVRDTAVFAHSELLEIADEPVESPICGDSEGWVELDGLYSGLNSGRWVIVAGERADVKDSTGKSLDGVKSAELVMLLDVRHDVALPATLNPPVQLINIGEGQTAPAPPPERGLPGDSIHTYVKFARRLNYCYKRDKVTIYGNVTKATHGETRRETLGSGDASRPMQSFTLRQPPLTYVAAPVPSGVATTLEVFVNDLRWHETDALSGLGPADRAYVTRADDEGKTTLTFGNGREGARPPTGVENIRAVYRNGIGKVGNVKAEQISLLVTRALGAKDVINPLRASGGADRESRDQARRNVPLAVAALDRLVSVQDYADFARTFAGIGKATAARLSDGRRTLVHLTIAGAEDIPIEPTSDLYQNLVRALRNYGSADQPLRVELRELLMLVISASVSVLADYLWEPVVAEIKRSLLDTFSFERRDLGQDVLLSEVISVIQRVPGVNYVDVDVLGAIPEKTSDVYGVRRLLTPAEITATVKALLADAAQPQPRVRVAGSGRVGGALRPAQLAFLSPDVPDTLILNQIG